VEVVAPLAVAVPLIAAAAIAAVGSFLPRLAADIAAVAVAAATCVLCVLLLARSGGGATVVWFGGWHPQDGVAIGVDFAVDAVGAGLAAFIAALTTAALVFSARFLEAEESHLHVLILAFAAGMVGFCLSGDLFNMFVFFEVASVAAFALSGYKVREREAVEGSLNFAITNSIGSFLLLTGIALVYGRTGALNLAQAGQALSHGPADGLVVVAFALIAAGFLVKAAIVPFHFWLPDAYAVAITPACLLFSGAMSELGLYGLGRVYFTVFSGPLGAHREALEAILIGAGVVTALLGAGMALAQDHLKRLLAFATVSYMGIFLIGLGTLGADGIAATTIYVIGDGCAKAALFACVGIVQHRLGGVTQRRLFARGLRIRRTGALFALGGLLLASLPPSGAFLGKSMLDDSLIAAGYGWAVAVVVTCSILTGGAVLLAAGRVFGGLGPRPAGDRFSEEEGPEPEVEGSRARTPAVMAWPAAALVAASIGVGVVPGIDDAATAAAERFVERPTYAREVMRSQRVAVPSVSAPPLRSIDWPLGVVSILGAVGVAGLGLRRPLRGARLGAAARQARRPLRAIRVAHSGHVGDYVAWLVAGAALLGGLVALATGT
jgi:multicomponent Na+:H+ antiporter subunit D